MNKTSEYFLKNKNRIKGVLLILQGIISLVSFALLIWSGVQVIKISFIDYGSQDFLPWLYIFYHPIESGLLNYLVTCAVLVSVSGILYLFIDKKRIRLLLNVQNRANPVLLAVLLLFSIICLLFLLFETKLKIKLVASLAATLIPFAIIFLYSWGHDVRWKYGVRLLYIIIISAFILITVDLISLMSGHVYLMNEFPDVYGKTYLYQGSRFVDNRSFLEQNNFNSTNIIQFFNILDNFNQKKRNLDNNKDYFKDYKHQDLRISQSFMKSSLENSRYDGSGPSDFVTPRQNDGGSDLLAFLKKADMEEIKQFYFFNKLEYEHLNMGRGQLNHIGHILNPINEYQLGKPVSKIYFQYGLGNTMLFKWIMGIFGGVSIQNYYKAYVLYLIYFTMFAIMLAVIFHNKFYVAASLIIVPTCFFLTGYIGLILAPGIVPSIHMLDAPVIILLVCFFRRENILYLISACFLSMVGIAINRQFGMFLSASLFAAMFIYILECKQGGKRILWAIVSFVFFICCIAVLKLFDIDAVKDIYKYLSSGFLSWEPHPVVVFSTIVYLVVSYLFLFLIKEKRFYLKYIFCLIFFYSQCILIYYYWSGLTNHLPQVVSFMYVQLFLMLFIIRDHLITGSEKYMIIPDMAGAVIVFLGLMTIFPFSVKNYLSERAEFKADFRNHQVYNWRFDRASLVSTANPAPVSEGVSLIRSHSDPQNPGIYIISKYDNILPFLADRYSKMPIFELSSYIFSNKQLENVIMELKKKKPEILFIDSDIDMHDEDKWKSIYFSNFMNNERVSRLKRYNTLERIFMSIKDDYKKIDETMLLSVYERDQDNTVRIQEVKSVD